MPTFSSWFNNAYKKWSLANPGGEDFLAFCDRLGIPPGKVLSWLEGKSAPQGAESLNIAGLLGPEVYALLGQSEPDPALVEIYRSFGHLSAGERSRLALALWEAQSTIHQKGLPIESEEAKRILRQAMKRHGL